MTPFLHIPFVYISHKVFHNACFFIDREAGEIILLVASVCLFVCLYSIQNGCWAFKMVVVSTGCVIVVDHAFNSYEYRGHVILFPIKNVLQF